MLKTIKKNKLIQLFLILLVVCLVMNYSNNKSVETEDRTTKVEELETTKIIERPSGEKITTITRRKSKSETHSKSKTVSQKKDWIFGLSRSVGIKEPVHTISVDRRVLGDFFIGGYVRSDKEVGISIKYSY